MEHGTNYSFLIETLQSPTFHSVKALSDRFISELSDDQRNKLFDELKDSGNLQETEPQLAAYLYAFGDLHEARLQKAYSCLPQSFFSEEIEWIDYGCGQGLGAMVYHDFLQAQNLTSLVRRFTLIDPSERCLQRAALHVRRFFPHSEIRTVCKYMDELKADDLFSGTPQRTLHLFSNLPGMSIRTVEHLAALIGDAPEGYHSFVCVGPYYRHMPERMAQLDVLLERLKIPKEAVVSEDCGEDEFVPGRSWTCALRIFVKGKQMPKSEPPAEAPLVVPVASEELPEPDISADASSHEELPVDSGEEKPQIDQILDALNEPEEPEYVGQLRAAAEQGEAAAQNRLGYLYDVGKDVFQNDAEAVRWYRRAAAQDYAMAQYNLGNRYLAGRGVPQDYGEAAKWYLKAAEQGVLPAMNNLGVIYATGQGVKRNEAEAVKWYRKAAAKGDQTAIRNLRKRGISD